MNFQYAHLSVKTNVVFIPNNIPYFIIIFALCELFSTTSCVFTRVVTDTPVKHLILSFIDTCTKEKHFPWPYSVGRKMRKLNSARISDVSSTCAGGTINRGPYKRVPGQLQIFYYPSGKVTSIMIRTGILSCTNGIRVPCPSLRTVTEWLMTLASDT
jgi:hypothetical protein